MSIATVGARLVDIQEDIDGVRKAYRPSTMPNSLGSLLLPAVINFAGPATYEGEGSGDITETRTWTMALYVVPAQRPIDAAKKAAKVEPFFRRFMIAFADAQQLNDLGDVQWAWIGEDGGAMSLEYAGDWFAGTQFSLTVKETWNTTVST